MGSFIQIGSIWIDISQYNLKDARKCESSAMRDNDPEHQLPHPPLEASNNHISSNESNNHNFIDLTNEIFIDSTNDNFIDLTDDNVIGLTDDNVIDLTGDDDEDIAPVVRRTVILNMQPKKEVQKKRYNDDWINVNFIDLTGDNDNEDIAPVVGITACDNSKKGKRKFNRVSRKSGPTTMKKDDAIDKDGKPKKTCFEIMKELGPGETICHPNEVVVQKCKTMKQIRSKTRKSKVPWDERFKHVKNLVPQTKEYPKGSDLISTKKTNLVGVIVISEPRKSEMEGMHNVSNNNDAESNILVKEKGKMIQTNEELGSSSSSEDEELGIALRNSRLFQYPLQFGEGTSKFFQEGTNLRPQLNIEEGIEENSLKDFHILPNNIRKNSVLTKENGVGDVAHDYDDVRMLEVAKILINDLPYIVKNENGMMKRSKCFEASRENLKFEKRSKNNSQSKNKRNPKRR